MPENTAWTQDGKQIVMPTVQMTPEYWAAQQAAERQQQQLAAQQAQAAAAAAKKRLAWTPVKKGK